MLVTPVFGEVLDTFPFWKSSFVCSFFWVWKEGDAPLMLMTKTPLYEIQWRLLTVPNLTIRETMRDIVQSLE